MRFPAGAFQYLFKVKSINLYIKIKDPLIFAAIGYVFGVVGTLLGYLYLNSYAIGAGIGLAIAFAITAALRK